MRETLSPLYPKLFSKSVLFRGHRTDLCDLLIIESCCWFVRDVDLMLICYMWEMDWARGHKVTQENWVLLMNFWAVFKKCKIPVFIFSVLTYFYNFHFTYYMEISCVYCIYNHYLKILHSSLLWGRQTLLHLGTQKWFTSYGWGNG